MFTKVSLENSKAVNQNTLANGVIRIKLSTLKDLQVDITHKTAFLTLQGSSNMAKDQVYLLLDNFS